MLLSRYNRKILTVFSVLAAAALVSSCGFRPLHQKTSQQPAGLQSQLASISIENPKDRLHQQVRNRLLYLLGASDDAIAARYRLEVKLSEKESSILVQRSSRTDRMVYNLKAEFKLFDLADIKNKIPVYSGTDLVKRSYNRTDSEFNNIAARKNASEQTSRKIAENIHLRISAWLSRNGQN